MSNVINFILTNSAAELIPKVLNGKTLNFTRMAVGDGFSYDTTVAKGYTTLVNEVLSLDITKSEIQSPSSVKITSAFKNTDAQKEFYYREVGLFAQDPDTGEEVLYAYGNRNEAAELITPTGSNIVTKQLIFIIAVGDSANVTFNVNADVYALQSDMLDVQENKADKNLSNTGMLTNCLLEVPQDIKLELNDGVLTLKAGSIVTSPNGKQKIIESDVNYRSTWANGQMVIMYSETLGLNYSPLVNACFSGDSEPVGFSEGSWWFDTANKTFKLYDEGVWIEQNDFYMPIGLATATKEGFTSIDQMFNGMGYIGSTVFVLPGVKGLIPNGKNPDGTLNNINLEVNKLSIQDFHITNAHTFGIDANMQINVFARTYDAPTVDYVYFDKTENFIYASLNKYKGLFLGEVSGTNGPITSFKPKALFRPVDKVEDKQWLSSLAMPSEKYIDYELGISGSTYTAPANGYFVVRCTSTNVGYFILHNSTTGISEERQPAYVGAAVTPRLEVRKGDVVQIEYDLSLNDKIFRFYYAEGEVI